MGTTYSRNQSLYRLLGLMFVLSLLFSACSGATEVPATEAVTITDTPTKLAEPTLMPTATSAPTATFTPTPTLIPLQRISAFNASQIEQIYQMGLGTVRSAAWSPDSQMLVMASSVGLYVYDMQAFWNDKKTLTLTKFIEYPDLNVVIFSPDGTHFATGARDGSIQIWEKDGSSLFDEPKSKHQGEVTALAFDPGSEILVSGGNDGIVHFTNISGEIGTARRVFNSQLGNPTITGIVFSNDGTLLYVGGTGDFNGVNVYSLPDLDRVKYVEIPNGREFAFSRARGLVAVLAGDFYAASLSTYDLETLRSRLTIYEYEDFYPGLEYMLSFSPTGSFLASSIWDYSNPPYFYNGVLLWDTFTGGSGCHLEVHEQAINSLSFSPDDTVLLVSGVSGVSLWDTEECILITDFNQHASVSSMALPESGERLYITQNTTLSAWDISSNSIAQQWELPEDLLGIIFAPSGNKLATLSSAGISVLLIDGNQLSNMYELLQENIVWADLGESNGSTYLAYTLFDQPSVTVVDIGSGNEITNFALTSNQPSSMDLSPDGTKLGIYTYQITRVIDVARNDTVEIVGCQYSWGSDLYFSPQGTFLAEVCDNYPYEYIYMLNTTNGKVVWLVNIGETIGMISLAFSLDEKILATGGLNGMIYLWGVETGEKIAEWRAHNDPVTSLVFSKDGTMLISGSEDGTIRVWGIK